MNPIVERDAQALKDVGFAVALLPLQDGSNAIQVKGVQIPAGWDRQQTDIWFIAPPAFPAAAPDCFWVSPGAMRLQNGGTPQGTNDANPIPGLTDQGPMTWFSWHVQSWNPNSSSLLTFLQVVKKRFDQLQ